MENLKCTLNKTNHFEKISYSMITTISHSGKGKTIEMTERSVVAKERGCKSGINKWSTGDF